MKKPLLITVLCLISTNAHTEKKVMYVEKIIRENSIVVKTLNRLGFNVFSGDNKPEKKKEENKEKIWVAGKSLRECMGNSKLINNNVVRCQSGYFKESE